ncbi:MAG: DEAD/DEAH box helicase [Treponema sp.]|jgi:ATP-dependent Lhr-like helicase|nr:DEAD/DEAH box helicase [Treponema sp.]
MSRRGTSSNFSRLDPLIREYIYEKKWHCLKDIQEDAIAAILDTPDNVLITAGTASGKTEACFFPIITALLEERALKKQNAPDDGISPIIFKESVEVLYIGPLKALINDQFERLKPLLHSLEIPLWRWHGDVEQTHKQKLLKNPSGILQITPESLEALLLRQPERIKELFCNLKFVVIDEVHAFIGTDRGSQLICLLERIRSLSIPRRIGLSATLGTYSSALAWLEAGTPNKAVLIGDRLSGEKPHDPELNSRFHKDSRHLSLAVDYFQGEGYYEAIYEQCQGDIKLHGDKKIPVRKCIIFTNSRIEAEEATAALKKIARKRREEDHFHVHHGSIAASLRAEAERTLRETEGAQTIAATATLELGIDIGKLDRIIQIGAPMSVSAFVQRLGRSGRRSGISQMYFCSREALDSINTSPLEKIPWALIKTIASIELYIEKNWTEDADTKPCPFSLLCHQTMSILASLGEQSMEELMTRVFSLPPFANVEKKDYEDILYTLETAAYIEKTEEEKFIIGLEGERIVNHYSFYSVFPDEEEFRVTFQGKDIGKLNFIPPEGAGLVLGGKNWKVESIRLRNKEVCVVPGTESGARVWRGGSSSLHPKVVQRMRQVLCENRHYRYLSTAASERLSEARQYAEENDIKNSLFIPIKNDTKELPFLGNVQSSFFLLPWLGSRGIRTLSLILQKNQFRENLGIIFSQQENPYAYRISSRLSLEKFKAELQYLVSRLNPSGKSLNIPAETLIEARRIPFIDKYDYLLPPRLLVKQYAANMLNVAELLGIRG